MLTPDQFSQNIQDAVKAEFPDWQPGNPQVFPSAFFRSDITVTAPDGQTEQRSPSLCATDAGTAQLMEVLNGSGRETLAVKGLKSLPAVKLEGGWSDSDNVPWLIFGGTSKEKQVVVNGGTLENYFNHGWPGSRALNSCELEVLDALAEAGLRDPLTQNQRNEVMANL